MSQAKDFKKRMMQRRAEASKKRSGGDYITPKKVITREITYPDGTTRTFSNQRQRGRVNAAPRLAEKLQKRGEFKTSNTPSIPKVSTPPKAATTPIPSPKVSKVPISTPGPAKTDTTVVPPRPAESAGSSSSRIRGIIEGAVGTTVGGAVVAAARKKGREAIKAGVSRAITGAKDLVSREPAPPPPGAKERAALEKSVRRKVWAASKIKRQESGPTPIPTKASTSSVTPKTKGSATVSVSPSARPQDGSGKAAGAGTARPVSSIPKSPQPIQTGIRPQISPPKPSPQPVVGRVTPPQPKSATEKPVHVPESLRGKGGKYTPPPTTGRGSHLGLAARQAKENVARGRGEAPPVVRPPAKAGGATAKSAGTPRVTITPQPDVNSPVRAIESPSRAGIDSTVSNNAKLRAAVEAAREENVRLRKKAKVSPPKVASPSPTPTGGTPIIKVGKPIVSTATPGMKEIAQAKAANPEAQKTTVLRKAADKMLEDADKKRVGRRRAIRGAGVVTSNTPATTSVIPPKLDTPMAVRAQPAPTVKSLPKEQVAQERAAVAKQPISKVRPGQPGKTPELHFARQTQKWASERDKMTADVEEAARKRPAEQRAQFEKEVKAKVKTTTPPAPSKTMMDKLLTQPDEDVMGRRERAEQKVTARRAAVRAETVVSPSQAVDRKAGERAARRAAIEAHMKQKGVTQVVGMGDEAKEVKLTPRQARDRLREGKRAGTVGMPLKGEAARLAKTIGKRVGGPAVISAAIAGGAAERAMAAPKGEGTQQARRGIAGDIKALGVMAAAGKAAPALGRVFLPVGAAVGAYNIGQAVKEGYRAFSAHRDAKANEAYMTDRYGSIEAATRTRRERALLKKNPPGSTPVEKPRKKRK